MKIFKRLTALALCLGLALSAASCGKLKKATPEEVQQSFDAFCDELLAGMVASDPMSAHFLVTDPSDYGVEFKEEDITLGEVSIEGIKSGIESNASLLRHLKMYEKEVLTKEQQLTYDTLSDYLEMQSAYKNAELLNCYFSPMSGIVSNLSTNFIEYIFYDKEDVDIYLTLLADVDRYMEQIFEVTREQAKEGYFLSDDNADLVIEQCEKILNAEVEPMTATFDEKIAELDLTEAEKSDYIERNRECVQKYYLPVYEKTIDLMEELMGSRTNEGGLCGYGEEGKKFYEAIIMDNTSSKMTPEEVAEFLEDKASDLLKEATALAVSDYEAFESWYDYSPDFDTPDEVFEFLIENVEKDFPKPKTTNYNIEYQNKACEVDGVIAYYLLSRIDDISINNVKVNGSAVQGDSLSLYTTLAHEGYPGHLYQHTAFCSNDKIHDIRKTLSFIGSTEGWAQYASYCALGYLDISDAMKRLIYINDLLTYVVVSRVDIGVNYEGWDLDDTYRYLKNFFEVDRNYDDEDNSVKYFYNTVTGDPGSFIPYTVGYIKMMDMRERAEKTLGEAFDAVEYHEWLGELGITSFGIYEEQLELWLAAKQEA
ncbi:MAG: DUF885 domain-containing protein [Butyrivibrio sp.]|nr:DUF885 domain-containing protein [Butyrivibrio sp.]